MNLYYKEHKVSEELAPFVHCYWSMVTDGHWDDISPLQRCFPSGCIELIVQVRGKHMEGLLNYETWFTYPKAIFTGLCDRAAEWISYGQCHIVGVRLTPEAAIKLFHLPLKEYYNSYIDAVAFGGKKVALLIERITTAEKMDDCILLLEQFLAREIKNCTLEPNYFTEALRLIRHQNDLQIADLSKKVYVCERQLQRSFQKELGISPKNYLKVMRLYKAHQLGLIRSDNFTDIAYQLGYADAAHFCRDFKNYFGVPPEAHFNSINLKWAG